MSSDQEMRRQAAEPPSSDQNMCRQTAEPPSRDILAPDGAPNAAADTIAVEVARPIASVPRRISLRVSGSRVGDAARPVDDLASSSGAASNRFGLRVHRTIAPKPAAIVAPEDFATLEDYS